MLTTKVVVVFVVFFVFVFERERGGEEFMMFRLLENAFISQKLNLDIFTLAPRQNSPRCLSSPSGKGKSLTEEISACSTIAQTNL